MEGIKGKWDGGWEEEEGRKTRRSEGGGMGRRREEKGEGVGKRKINVHLVL